MAHFWGPGAEEGDIIEQGSSGDLGKGLYHILHVHMHQQQPKPEAALQLPNAVVHILRLQKVKPARRE